VSPQSPLLSCWGRTIEQSPFPPAAFTAFIGTMDSSDSSPERLASARGLAPSVARLRPRTRSPAFSAFLSRRAVPATPEEDITHVEHPAMPAAFARTLPAIPPEGRRACDQRPPSCIQRAACLLKAERTGRPDLVIRVEKRSVRLKSEQLAVDDYPAAVFHAPSHEIWGARIADDRLPVAGAAVKQPEIERLSPTGVRDVEEASQPGGHSAAKGTQGSTTAWRDRACRREAAMFLAEIRAAFVGRDVAFLPRGGARSIGARARLECVTMHIPAGAAHGHAGKYRK